MADDSSTIWCYCQTYAIWGSLKSNWALNKRGKVPERGEFNPAYPGRGKTDGYLTGVFIHRSNNSGYTGKYNNGKRGISEGCLLIATKGWVNYNKQLKGVKSYKIRIKRD